MLLNENVNGLQQYTLIQAHILLCTDADNLRKNKKMYDM